MTNGYSGRATTFAYLRFVGMALVLLSGAGCHSAFVQASIVNHSGAPVHLVEVDYPSASFGTGELANGATFKYRFKILGSGNAKITWTTVHEKDESSSGPTLEEGQEGSLSITLTSDAARWQADLHSLK